MSNNYGPRIVTDGLVLCLDAADRNSYPGSGTTWYDISGNGRHYNMFGSVPFLNETNGCWDFTGVDPNGTSASSPLGFLSSGGIPFSTTSSFTVFSWLNQTVNTGRTGVYTNTGDGDGFRFGPNGGGIYVLSGPSFSNGTISAGSFSLNDWVLLCAVFDRAGELGAGPAIYGYVNNNSPSSLALSTQTAMRTTTPRIVRSGCCERFVGKLSSINVYNRALTQQEVLQNYNATKGRFGL